MSIFLKKMAEEVNSDRDVLNEDIKSFLKKVGGFAKKKLGQIKLFIKKVGNKMFPTYTKGAESGVLNSNGSVVAKWAGDSTKMTYIIQDPKVLNKVKTFIPIPESILYELRSQADTLKQLTKMDIGDVESIEDPDEDSLENTSTAKVDHDDLAEILNDLAYSLKFRKTIKDRVPSLLLMGPPGVGKTTVVNQFSAKNGFQVKILEIASIYKEILGGFPIVEEILNGKKTDKNLTPADKNKLAQFQKRVAMKATDALPPSNDKGKWILFMDEFNRDSEKMGAAMNLALTGNIGTSYTLPLKTIVIAAGNIGESVDGVPVAEIDSATWDRFERKVELQYDWVSWLDYQKEEAGETGFEGAPSIIKNFVIQKTKEEGDGWTVNLKQFDPDVSDKARVTPRTMSEFSLAMQRKALQDWDNDKIIGKNDKSFYEEGFKTKGFKKASDYYLHVNQLNKRYFADIARTSFGPGSADIIKSMMIGTIKAKEEAAAGYKPEDILTKWTSVRQGGKKKIKAKVGNEFAMKLASTLKKIKTVSNFKKIVDESDIDKKYLDKVDNDYTVWAAVNIHNFLKDSKLGMDVVAGICKSLSELRDPTQVDKKTNKVTKGKHVEIELLDRILAELLDTSDIFTDAWNTVANTAKQDMSETEEFKTAFTAAKKGNLLTGPPPSYITNTISGQALEDYLLITNLQMQEKKILRRLKTEAEKEAEKRKVEEGLHIVFDKLLMG